MEVSENLKLTLQRLYESTEKMIKHGDYISNSSIDEFLYKLEKRRCEIFEDREVAARMKEYNEKINNKNFEEAYNEYFAGQNYETSYEDGVLKILIPDKLPNLKGKPTDSQRLIFRTIINSCEQYKGLFVGERVMVIVRIYDETKNRWDIVT